MRTNSFRLSLVTLCVFSSMIPGAQAGFLEDFYDSSSGAAQGNVTAAGIYESAHLNIATGGGFVYRAPRTDFTPFQFTPPKLSAGCGGMRQRRLSGRLERDPARPAGPAAGLSVPGGAQYFSERLLQKARGPAQCRRLRGL